MRRPNGNDLGVVLMVAWTPFWVLRHPRETVWLWRYGGDRGTR